LDGDGTTLTIGSILGLVAGVALMGLGAHRLLTFGAGLSLNTPTTIPVLQYSGAVLIFFGGLVLVGIVYRGLRRLTN